MVHLAILAAMATNGGATVYVDGNAVSLPNAPAPMIQDNRVQVPMRALFEALGVGIQYLPELRQVVALGDREVTLVLDENFAYIDGQHRVLDYPPRIVNGQVMVPARFVSEALGASVRWDADRKTVVIRTDVPNAKTMEE
jgi:hypothetical protein